MVLYRNFISSLLLSSLLVCGSPAFASENNYVVKPGDTLWKLSQTYNTTVEELKRTNRLNNDNLFIGQLLQLTASTNTSRGTVARTPNGSWLPTEHQIASTLSINVESEKVTPPVLLTKVELVDWFTNGKQLFNSGEIFSVTDYVSQKQINLKVLSAGNHCDIEPATAEDTTSMKELFQSWTWTPRPVIIHQDGRNIAGSLSGMPHSIDTTPNNAVTGHFDLYLHNSIPHGSGVSKSYVQQHYTAVAQAAKN